VLLTVDFLSQLIRIIRKSLRNHLNQSLMTIAHSFFPFMKKSTSMCCRMMSSSPVGIRHVITYPITH